MNRNELINIANNWFENKGWTPLPFQRQTWNAFLKGKNGLLNAPTGSGKTYALWFPIILRYLDNRQQINNPSALQAIWITPLRALSVEIKQAAEKVIADLNLDIRVGIRTGDTSIAERGKQKEKMPHLLITTPESLHVMLATKGYKSTFENCFAVVVDEWHELLGTKRGVQTELALSRIRSLVPNLQIWGISATIGNLEQAREVLLGPSSDAFSNSILICANLKKKISVCSILPQKVDAYPWRGHMGLHLLDEVGQIIRKSKTTLIFTNVRSACEIWYQKLLEAYPEFAGEMAMHHGSIDKKIRLWVEQAIRDEQLKVVVCTSSLDLGVDFAAVETIIQVGSPKGVARFLQRAGRSNHHPSGESVIYFLATHAIELIEASALKKAVKVTAIEDRIPLLNAWDVLIQYLITLSVSDGFCRDLVLKEVQSTFCFQSITHQQWQWVLNFITRGSQSLHAYDEFKKVEINEEGLYTLSNRKMALQHRMQIGTIVGDALLHVRYLGGARLGTIEEWFAAKLQPGEVFVFAGKKLELYRIKNMEVLVRNVNNSKPAKHAVWMGGRLSLSAQMSAILREELYQAGKKKVSVEIKALEALFQRQQKESIVPDANQFLIESFKTREGFHLIFYPFEGHYVHQALAGLLAFRISLLRPVSFSLACNDYGFELLSDQEIKVEDIIDNDLFSIQYVHEDLWKSINATELSQRRFRDIAVISGLLFTGFPGKSIKPKHVQGSSRLLFEVFKEHEPDNLLLMQAYRETFEQQLEEGRLIQVLERILQQEIVVKYCTNPTPFSFPIITDRLREKLSSETLEARIQKMSAQYLKD